ncbi:FkbM family methyltransferase [Azospirillum doebereinerae]|uniref:Methyltransferase FkbM domain-containing protein n=1 Tax=Azospirillum doebereinerae TaxID=92933 RepID=A0A3S1CG48_9PROT|nr:FkbM family methyltransferase [Azospirillum doebereinerae]MCG5238890.1 hypothetical protein [Azospirillum doebereinerae]RUQ68903.1 hypothetical protein EJ913_17170 [Azospirillum doebereinerae]
MPVELDDLTPLFRQLRALAWQQHRERLSIADRQLMLTASTMSEALRARRQIRHLSDVEFQVFSQMGEDGIIEWLIQNLPIRSESFVEFGVEDYKESNTRYLLRHRNWKGFVIDASIQNVEEITKDSIFWRHSLIAKSYFIDRENINDILKESGFNEDIGLLSIDIDGNDYWVFDAIETVKPDIVICEYNAVFGDLHAVTVPYDPAFQRRIAHPSWLYFGASIRALEMAAARKGYVLLGSNLAGHNAFFVRGDLASTLSIEDRRARPSLIRESRDEDGALSYADGLDRAALIRDMPVLDLETGQTVALGSFGALYGPDWHARIASPKS